MRLLSALIALLILTISCAHTRVEEPARLTVHNPTGIVLKSKKAFSIDTENAGPITFYVIDAKKIPPNRKFYLQASDYIQPTYPPIELFSDSDGCLRFASDKTIALGEYPIMMQLSHAGEPRTFWLLSEDKNTSVRTTFIPYPLEAHGNDGAEASIIRLKSDGSYVECNGRYFNNNEILEVCTCSKEGEVKTSIRCEKGRFNTYLSPPNRKSFSDTITVKIKRMNGEEIALSYPFGRESSNKDILCGNPNKLTEADCEKIENALRCYYTKTQPETLI